MKWSYFIFAYPPYRMKKPKSKKGKKVVKAPESDLVKLGNRIKELRIEKGYTNYEYFAYEHEISRSQFGRYERGEDLRFTSLLRVVRALDMTLEEFFEDFE